MQHQLNVIIFIRSSVVPVLGSDDGAVQLKATEKRTSLDYFHNLEDPEFYFHLK